MTRRNMSTADRLIRLLVSAIIGILIFTGLIEGTLAIVFGLVAVVLIFTGAGGWCPFYAPLGISTNREEKE